MQNSAVIFVSHNIQFISKFCTKVAIFENGKITGTYLTKEGIQKYHCLFKQPNIQFLSNKLMASNFSLLDNNGKNLMLLQNRYKVKHGLDIYLSFLCDFDEHLKGAFSVEIINESQEPIISYLLDIQEFSPAKHKLTIPLNTIYLNSGTYTINLGFNDEKSRLLLLRLENLCPFVVSCKKTLWGKFIYSSKVLNEFPK